MAAFLMTSAGYEPLVIRPEEPKDVVQRECLLDRTMGPIRFRRASERLREGRQPAIALCAEQRGRVGGTVRLWHAKACGFTNALMLGPLAVDPDAQGGGIGGRLMHTAIAHAAERGYGAIVLVGDPEWYLRFGFRARTAHRLAMPGPFERHRLLGLGLAPGAFDTAHGTLRPGRPIRHNEADVLPLAA